MIFFRGKLCLKKEIKKKNKILKIQYKFYAFTTKKIPNKILIF